MLAGTEKILGNEYEDFIEAMICAAESDDLPVALQFNKIDKVSMKDVHEMMYDFHNDTGLDLTVQLFMCNECSKLHAFVRVDYPDEEDTMIQ